MKRNIACALGVGLLAVPVHGMAADAPTWDFVSLEYVLSGYVREGSVEEDLDGYRLRVAKQIGPIALFRAGSNVLRAEEGATDTELGSDFVGFGAHYAVPAGAVVLDFWGSINYESVSVGIVGTGIGLDVGVRVQILPELDAGIAMKIHGDIDFGNSDADYTGHELGATYAVLPGLAITGSFSRYELDVDIANEVIKYDDVFALGVRFEY